MEHALGEVIFPMLERLEHGLNPYCNGTCSRRIWKAQIRYMCQWVLILIVMEHALGEGETNIISMPAGVLILIVMEHALGAHTISTSVSLWYLLNPYCNGTCSRSKYRENINHRNSVLILIVMEHALGVSVHPHSWHCMIRLNPYCNGTCSRRERDEPH